MRLKAAVRPVLVAAVRSPLTGGSCLPPLQSLTRVNAPPEQWLRTPWMRVPAEVEDGDEIIAESGLEWSVDGENWNDGSGLWPGGVRIVLRVMTGIYDAIVEVDLTLNGATYTYRVTTRSEGAPGQAWVGTDAWVGTELW